MIQKYLKHSFKEKTSSFLASRTLAQRRGEVSGSRVGDANELQMNRRTVALSWWWSPVWRRPPPPQGFPAPPAPSPSPSPILVAAAAAVSENYSYSYAEAQKPAIPTPTPTLTLTRTRALISFEKLQVICKHIPTKWMRHYATNSIWEGPPGISYGLNSALAAKGVVVKEKAFQNLTLSQLKQKGATVEEHLSGVPVYIRGKFLGGNSNISKAQFSKLLKQVTTHISSISDIFVHDGAIGALPRIDAKVRVISDSSSAVLPISNFLWKTSTRAVSHDSCPITIYAASTISSSAVDALGLGVQGNNGFIAADTEHSSLILYGKAFANANDMKEALAALAGPIISSRGGLLLPARLLVCCDSMLLLFAPEETVRHTDLLVSAEAGVILSPQGVSPLFQNGSHAGPCLTKLPAAIILVSSDSSRGIPPVSKLSPGQAAYHFLAGYQNGKFIPAYAMGLSCIDPLDLAKALLSELKGNQIPSFLINANEGEKPKTGADLVNLVVSTLKDTILPFKPKGGDLRGRYKSFLTDRYQKLPEEFSF